MTDSMELYDFISRSKTDLLALASILESKSNISDCEIIAKLDDIVIEQLQRISSSCCDLCIRYRLNHD